MHASDIPEVAHIEKAAIVDSCPGSWNRGYIAIAYHDVEDEITVHTKLKLVHLIKKQPGHSA